VKRRDLLTRSALALLGATTRGYAASSTRSARSGQAAQPASGEPIIDIHQHLGYSGRPDDVLLAHQRAIGATTTILLPAGGLARAVLRNNSERQDAFHGSRCQRFQAIFVMQSRQDRRRDDSVAIRDLMPVRSCQPVDGHVGNARTEAGVWSTLVVTSHPLQQDGPKMAFMQHDQPSERRPATPLTGTSVVACESVPQLATPASWDRHLMKSRRIPVQTEYFADHSDVET
jgi:hypothetical protein